MSQPYLNVEQRPLDMSGSFKSLFSSAAGFLSRSDTEDEEMQSSGYTNFSDEETVFQGEFEKRWAGASPFRDAFRSMVGGSSAPVKPERSGFLASAREQGIVKTLTPGFLRTDEDEELANSCCPNLNYKQRIFGCACCFGLGQFLQFLSFGAAAGVLLGHPGRFARYYSLGNLMMVSGSFFLSGPQAQWRKMGAKDRAKTSITFVSMMILTLITVHAKPFMGRALLILLLVVVQWCAQVWYILSYIPYGHTIGRKVLRKLRRCIMA